MASKVVEAESISKICCNKTESLAYPTGSYASSFKAESAAMEHALVVVKFPVCLLYYIFSLLIICIIIMYINSPILSHN